MGALVMTNFGTLRDLKVAGDSVGERLFWQEQSELKDKGSIIIVLATDVPLSSRQLERVAKRAQSGIARTGGISGNGHNFSCVCSCIVSSFLEKSSFFLFYHTIFSGFCQVGARFLQESGLFLLDKRDNVITISLKENEQSKEEIRTYVMEIIHKAGSKGIGINELSNRVHGRYSHFNVKDFGYSQFSKFVQGMEGVQVYADKNDRKRVKAL